MKSAAALGLAGGAGFMMGVLAARLGVLKVQPEINAGHLVSAAATLVVALILNQVYNRHASTRNMERQLLLAHMDELRESLKELYHAFLSCPIGTIPSEVAQRIGVLERRLSNAVHSMEVALASCQLDAMKEFEALKILRFELKETLTDDPFPSGAFSAADLGRIQGKFTEVRDGLTRFTFAVNKALH